jgi:hypothetical protein
MKTQRERSLYPIVEKWMKRRFLCFKTAINKGLRYSRVDVIGISDVGGELSGEVQTMAVEVKRRGEPFATTSGQTLGYNVYANRVYLAEARKDSFSPDEMDIASHLGIGLVQIRGGRCREVLSSPFYSPIRRLNLLLLEALGLGRCRLCDSFFEIGSAENLWSNVIGDNVQRAIKQEKGLVFWSEEVADRKRRLGLTNAPKGYTDERRFICAECVAGLLAIQEKRVKAWFSDFRPRGD